MEPARQVPKDKAQEELEDILREAEMFRRKARRGPPSERGSSEPPPAGQEPASAPKPPAAQPAAGAGSLPSIRFETEELRLAERLAEVRPRRSFKITPQLVAQLALGALVAFVWARALTIPIARPPEPIDPLYTEASARWAVVIASQRIGYFMRAYSRTPARLEEIGLTSSDSVTYERVSDDQYRLTATGPNGPLLLDSADSPQAFLDQGLETLRRAAVQVRR